MSLSGFIHGHHEQIIREFAVFAKTLMPSGVLMSEAELRDHAEEMLTAIAVDLGTAQTADEESEKSRGLGTAQAMASSGRLHADARIRHGFSLGAVLADFRALRATVLRLYESSGESDLAEVRRFNESIDETLTVSLERFASRTDSFRDQSIGILGHDLRNPLSAITTGAALLTLPEDNPERRGRVAFRILSSAKRMERMIGALLDLTRARLGGTIPITRKRADLHTISEEVLIECRVANPGAVLRFEQSGGLVGDWDADRLAQVVSNLVGNAIQHGEGTPVTLSAREEDEGVTLSVHNGGAPIPAAMVPFIFEPLARGQAENTTGSIGLGLFIARAIVSAHGGDIQVSSSSEDGTTFTVSLPKTPNS
jgi:signal transduction histidine kinase